MPARFEVAEKDVRACGVLLKIDIESGRAQHIERFMISVKQVDGD
jgi:calcineurin-like phosphoesterase